MDLLGRPIKELQPADHQDLRMGAMSASLRCSHVCLALVGDKIQGDETSDWETVVAAQGKAEK